MTREEFDEKIKTMQNDPIIMEQIRNAPDAETLSTIFKDYGIIVSADELESISLDEESELTPEAMAEVSGGGLFTLVCAGVKLIKVGLDHAPGGKYEKEVQTVFNKVYNFVTGR